MLRRVLIAFTTMWWFVATLWVFATLRWPEQPVRLLSTIDTSVRAAWASLSGEPPSSLSASPQSPSPQSRSPQSRSPQSPSPQSPSAQSPAGERASAQEQGTASRAIYQTTADQLYRDYDSNAVKTQSRIGSSWIRVTGIVDTIDEDSAGRPIVTLFTNGANDAIMTLGADQRAAAAQLVKGDSVQILCDRMQRLQGIPAGSGCTLALIHAGSEQVYLSVSLTSEGGYAPIYVVGPMSQATCLIRRDSLSEQLRGDDRIAFKHCTPRIGKRIAPRGCRLIASVPNIPALPRAHLWRYDCRRR